jgi:broad specificity phosphatase PhoE
MALQVIGIRHGEVHNPRNVIYSGLPGYVLSEEGRRQAAAVAKALADVPITALYASPLERAVETASFIADLTGAEIVEDIRLHEWRHWAQWAGMTWEELRTKGREAFDRYTTDPGSVTSGESLSELADRVEEWLADVSRDHADGVVVAVTHLEPLRAILLRRLGRPANDLFQLQISQCEVVKLAPQADATPVALEALPALAGGRM